MQTNHARALLLAAASFATPAAVASSHSEAPFVKEAPKIDATDFYMFRSYEPGREGFVTIVANYYPLQDPYGGPNYFSLDPDAAYEIKIDNNGDAQEDITFTFRLNTVNRDIALNIGGVNVSVPLYNVGLLGPSRNDNAALNVLETYTLGVSRGLGPVPLASNAMTGETVFKKPADYVGTKTFPNYAQYASDHVYSVNLPGSATPGRLFVGQRKDPFVVNLGEIFDLVNTNPLGAPNAETDDLADKNVTSFILEVPISYLLPAKGGNTIIGGWTTASLPRGRVLTPSPTFERPASEVGTMIQVSRLGMPLVNEVVIGLKDKNRFNASKPSDDGQFLTYVTNPTLPALLNILFPTVTAPCLPRNDLVQVFLTGVPGLNQPSGVVASEMLRLNTATPSTPAASQNRLGVIGGDLAGFPNGRRPGDDVVDVALRVVMGKLISDTSCAPSGQLPFTDGAFVDATAFDNAFPYIRTPLPGAN
ncbi:MAG TPA: DUF4331 domain-containing protein [Phycisphaerales bacterium]|nr:DUF4331 domain-containing protein [Phycisphaerales bacterium]